MDTADVPQRQLFARSERVKGIDFHPVEPWILTTLYSGMLAFYTVIHRMEFYNGCVLDCGSGS